MLRITDFDYNLPQELIAQKPTFPRDQCRLLVLDRKSGKISHHRFFEIEKFLRAGDVLILNDSKVFKARLFGWLSLRADPPAGGGAKQSRASMGSPRPDALIGIPILRRDSDSLAMTNVKVEIFLLRAIKDNVWEVLGNPGRKLKAGVKVWFSRKVWGEIIGQRDGKYLMQFNISNDELMKWAARHGHVPVPPYIGREPKRAEEYQTVYAKHLGSVAAPTAGFHFTKSLLNKLRRKGVEVHYITLHVGYGTFKPIKTERVEEHKMEAEWVEILKSTAEAIERAKKDGRRVVAVGTTTVRALEGMCPLPQPLPLLPRRIRLWRRWEGMKGRVGEVNIFITPGFKFQVIDALITNFHLPKSTLLLLVSAFVGRDLILKAYQEAIKKEYHFYSFGDAMLII